MCDGDDPDDGLCDDTGAAAAADYYDGGAAAIDGAIVSIDDDAASCNCGAFHTAAAGDTASAALCASRGRPADSDRAGPASSSTRTLDHPPTAAVVGADAGTFVGTVDCASARAGARANYQREQVLRGARARGYPANCDCGGAATSTKCAVGWTAAVDGADAGTWASPGALASTRTRARTRTSASADASCCAGPGMAGGAFSGICLSSPAARGSGFSAALAAASLAPATAAAADAACADAACVCPDGSLRHGRNARVVRTHVGPFANCNSLGTARSPNPASPAMSYVAQVRAACQRHPAVNFT